jgi:hypothetical protein
MKELKQSRNVRPSFNSTLGYWGALAYTGAFFVLGLRTKRKHPKYL